MAQVDKNPASPSSPSEVRVPPAPAAYGVPHGLRIAPGSSGGITDELLLQTQRVWSRVYQRPLDEYEAKEILLNVKQFAEVLLRAENQP